MDNSSKISAAIQQLDYNVNFSRRIIYLEGEIDTFSAPFILERINVIRDFSEKGKADDPINLYITSPGGDINGLTAVVDLFEALTCKVNTYGMGHVASAAVWLLAAGTGVRRLAPNTEVMVHEISTWLRGTSSDVENEAKQLMITQKNLYTLLDKYSKQNDGFWASTLKSSKNYYITPENCLKFGLADEILKPNSL